MGHWRGNTKDWQKKLKSEGWNFLVVLLCALAVSELELSRDNIKAFMWVSL